MSREAIILTALVLLAGCKSERIPEASAPVGVGYRVDRLFTHEGCTVFRFVDGGYSRYFTRCDSAAAAGVSWTESCGKNCTRTESIPTVYGNEQR